MAEYEHLANLKGPRGDKGDSGIAERGQLPAGTNLDDLITSADAGVWRLLSSRTYGNMPDGTTSSFYQAAQLIVSPSDLGRSGSQIIMFTDRMAYRTMHLDVWNPWRFTVSSATVQSMITSTNVDHPLLDGQILVVTPGRREFTDFRYQTPGQYPVGFQNQWGSQTSNFRVVAEPGSPGGKVLEWNSTASERGGIRWVANDGRAIYPNTTVSEILIRARSNTSAAFPRPFMAAIGSEGTETGYFSYLTSGGAAATAAIVRSGTATGATNTKELNFQPWQWTWCRLRYNNTRVMTRYWLDGTREPEAWDSVIGIDSNSLLNQNHHAGVYQTTSGRVQIANISIAADGGRAPRGAW